MNTSGTSLSSSAIGISNVFVLRIDIVLAMAEAGNTGLPNLQLQFCASSHSTFYHDYEWTIQAARFKIQPLSDVRYTTVRLTL